MRRWIRLGRDVLCAAEMLALAVCATGAVRHAQGPPPATESSQALNSPVRGLSLARREIPEVLLTALQAPYALPPTRDCATLGTEIGTLDAALGPDADLDLPSGDRNDLGWRLFAGGVKSLIPYFGWVRRLSGAERRDREAFAAREAGIIRRAYLKGLGEALACPAPATPLRGRTSTRQAPWHRSPRTSRA